MDAMYIEFSDWLRGLWTDAMPRYSTTKQKFGLKITELCWDASKKKGFKGMSKPA